MDVIGLVALILVIIVIIALISMYVIYYYDRGNLIETGIAWSVINSGLNASNAKDNLTISGTDLYLIPADLATGTYTVNVEVKPNIGDIQGRPFLFVNLSNVAINVIHNNSINSWVTIMGIGVSQDVIPPHASAQYIITSFNRNNQQYGVTQIY